MSQENVDAFKRVTEAFKRRDIGAMLAELDPEVEWHPGLLAFLGGEATVYRGHEGIRELVRDLDEHFAEFSNEYSEIRDLGDQVLAIGRIRARGKASGAETVSPLAFLVESKDGKAIWVRTYLDPRKPRSRGAARIGDRALLWKQEPVAEGRSPASRRRRSRT